VENPAIRPARFSCAPTDHNTQPTPKLLRSYVVFDMLNMRFCISSAAPSAARPPLRINISAEINGTCVVVSLAYFPQELVLHTSLHTAEPDVAEIFIRQISTSARFAQAKFVQFVEQLGRQKAADLLKRSSSNTPSNTRPSRYSGRMPTQFHWCWETYPSSARQVIRYHCSARSMVLSTISSPRSSFARARLD
jgi:hypothetical protein